MNRRMSHALAIRSTYTPRRVTQVRPGRGRAGRGHLLAERVHPPHPRQQHAVRHAERDDEHDDRQPHPGLGEGPLPVAQQHEHDAEHEDRVDEVLRDHRHPVAGLRDREAARARALLGLGAVHAVEEHRPDTHDRHEDVEDQDDPVERRLRAHA